jgi:hypothetical protein
MSALLVALDRTTMALQDATYRLHGLNAAAVATLADLTEARDALIREGRQRDELLALLKEAVAQSDKDIARLGRIHPAAAPPRTDECQDLYDRIVATIARIEKP